MMYLKKLQRWSLIITTVAFAPLVLAQPALQVGAPGGPGEGTFADYIDVLENPTETDTALTSGNTVWVGGLYQNNNVVNLGGQYTGGDDWGDVDENYSIFNGSGAILLVAVPDGELNNAVNNLTIDGESAIYSSSLLNSLFPNNHDPLKDNVSDFLFFDIGDFDKVELIPNFVDESVGNKLGDILELTLGGTEGLDWIHFDVIALETIEQGGQMNSNIRTTIENNPGSHDLTWKPREAPVSSYAGLLMGLILLTGLFMTMRRRA